MEGKEVLTRSRAQARPPWIWTNLSWPWGGSPRRARTFWIPLDLMVSRAWSIFSTGMLVQVRCIIVSTQMMFCILLAMSKVRSAVEPPAPQVMSQKEGLWETILSILSNRLSTPSSVFGGKNSKEKTTLLLLLLSPPFESPAAAAALILSITFILCCLTSAKGEGERIADRMKELRANPHRQVAVVVVVHWFYFFSIYKQREREMRCNHQPPPPKPAEELHSHASSSLTTSPVVVVIIIIIVYSLINALVYLLFIW